MRGTLAPPAVNLRDPSIIHPTPPSPPGENMLTPHREAAAPERLEPGTFLLRWRRQPQRLLELIKNKQKSFHRTLGFTPPPPPLLNKLNLCALLRSGVSTRRRLHSSPICRSKEPDSPACTYSGAPKCADNKSQVGSDNTSGSVGRLRHQEWAVEIWACARLCNLALPGSLSCHLLCFMTGLTNESYISAQ